MEAAKVSARFDRKTAANLRRLEKKLEVNRSAVLARAVNDLAQKELPLRRKYPNAYEALMASGFVGGGTGKAPPDLSSNYKKYLWERTGDEDRHR